MSDDMSALESMGKVLSTDVLVVGGGIAGLAAAISAKEAVPDVSVLVVDKATNGWGGKANKGGGNLAFLAPEDSVDEFLKFRVEKVGCYLDDQELLREFISEMHGVLQRTESWGATIFHNPDGTYLYVRWADTMPWRMALCEQDITESLLRFSKKQGTKFVDHVAIVDLLKDGDKVVGAVGFSVIDGTFYTIKAKATILANGNQNYRLMRRWASGRGDGIAAAYRAGAEMRNAEFGSFINWVFADTKEVCQGAEDCLYNAKGENISKPVRPEIEADVHSKEVVAWYKAIVAGDGPVYANMAENYINNVTAAAFHTDVAAKRPITTAFWTRTIGKAMAAAKNHGPMQEVHPGFIGEHSPVRVDHQMATSVPGLYAVGDTSASGSGWAGAVPAPPGRMRGGGLVNGLWSGMRGGAAAAAHAAGAAGTGAGAAEPGGGAGADEPRVDVAQVEALKARMFAPLERPDGVEPPELVRAIQDVMSPVSNSIYKSEARMKTALATVLEIKAKLPQLRAKDWHYLAACNEVASMVNSAEMFYRASLERKESRGWQIREDYPDRDDKNWLKWIIVKDVDGEMVVSTEAVPIERYPIKP